MSDYKKPDGRSNDYSDLSSRDSRRRHKNEEAGEQGSSCLAVPTPNPSWRSVVALVADDLYSIVSVDPSMHRRSESRGDDYLYQLKAHTSALSLTPTEGAIPRRKSSRSRSKRSKRSKDKRKKTSRKDTPLPEVSTLDEYVETTGSRKSSRPPLANVELELPTGGFLEDEPSATSAPSSSAALKSDALSASGSSTDMSLDELVMDDVDDLERYWSTPLDYREESSSDDDSSAPGFVLPVTDGPISPRALDEPTCATSPSDIGTDWDAPQPTSEHPASTDGGKQAKAGGIGQRKNNTRRCSTPLIVFLVIVIVVVASGVVGIVLGASQGIKAVFRDSSSPSANAASASPSPTAPERIEPASLGPTPAPISATTSTPSRVPSGEPSWNPSRSPSIPPTFLRRAPLLTPSQVPSIAPSTSQPPSVPSLASSGSPSLSPSRAPSTQPTLLRGAPPLPDAPSVGPSAAPSTRPSNAATTSPSLVLSVAPSGFASESPSVAPSSAIPSSAPTELLKSIPTTTKSVIMKPSFTNTTTEAPAVLASAALSLLPVASATPSTAPSLLPTATSMPTAARRIIQK